MFGMHRVFCAALWDLEGERIRFSDLVGQINETVLMPGGLLFVPVSLPSITDKRPYQYTIDENIRTCRHAAFILTEDWGPVQRNFRRDYELAMQCLADPALPMQDVAVLLKLPVDGCADAPGLPEPRATFSTAAEFDECATSLLSGWAAILISAGSA
jgi:hypothetical protein